LRLRGRVSQPKKEGRVSTGGAEMASSRKGRALRERKSREGGKLSFLKKNGLSRKYKQRCHRGGVEKWVGKRKSPAAFNRTGKCQGPDLTWLEQQGEEGRRNIKMSQSASLGTKKNRKRGRKRGGTLTNG